MTVWNHQAVIQPHKGTVPDDVTGINIEKAYKLLVKAQSLKVMFCR